MTDANAAADAGALPASYGNAGANGTNGAAGAGNAAEGDQAAAEAAPEDAATMRTQLAELRQADRNGRRRVKELENELATIRAASMTETERAIAEAVANARQEADNSWRDRFLTLRIERLAAAKMADPTDAVRLIDAAELTTDADDNELTALIDALIAAKPYLANGAGSRIGATPPPTLDRGPSSGGNPPSASSQMNQLMRRPRR